MKTILLLFFWVYTNGAIAQLYSRETNNNTVYDDSSAKKEIEILHKIIQNGDQFEEIATKYSQDPGSYKKGGLLSPSTMEEYVPEYRNVVLKMRLNEVSKPFRRVFSKVCQVMIC